jgi:hypothetical protein
VQRDVFAFQYAQYTDVRNAASKTPAECEANPRRNRSGSAGSRARTPSEPVPTASGGAF